MARRFTRTRGRLGAVRRESLWIALDVVSTTLAGASAAVLIGSLNAAALALRPFTIVRTRGVFGCRSDQVITTEQYQAALGISVVTDQAIGVGITAVPTPQTDSVSDMFFVYEQFMGDFVDQSSVGFESNGLLSMQFDSKAMRRVNDDQDEAITMELSAASDGAIVRLFFRQLLKLH